MKCKPVLGLLAFVVGVLSIAVSYLSTYMSRGNRGRLVVGVLSGRERQQQRDAIRATWGHLPRDAGIRVLFVVGDGCDVASYCKLDPYSCDAWEPAGNISAGDVALELGLGARDVPAAVGVLFAVLRPVVVRRVAVFAGAEVGTVLLETVDGRRLAAAEPPASGAAAPLAAHLLPAGFHGRLRLAGGGRPTPCRRWLPAPAGLPVRLTALLTADGRHVQPGLEPLCWPLRLIFTVHEAAEEEQEQQQRAGCRRPDAERTERALAEEAARHGDLLRLPGPDVYRRLPDKLLGFFAWVSAHSSAEWVIKCDDDVVLDLPRIMMNLPVDTGVDVWWGYFRYNWPTDRYGKWAEYVYQAEVYPPFACGTASVLSSSVVRWLAGNARYLTRFQGEDVSLGIWLSGLAVRRVPDSGWWCGQPAGYSLGQLSPEAVRRAWRCLRRRGRLELCTEDGSPEPEAPEQ